MNEVYGRLKRQAPRWKRGWLERESKPQESIDDFFRRQADKVRKVSMKSKYNPKLRGV